MKRHILIATLLCTSSIYASENVHTQTLTQNQEGIKYINMLGSTLKSKLQAQFKTDPSGMSAIGFCTAEAQTITQEVNTQLPTYAKVRRTSLRTRNSINKADATDISMMQSFEKSIKAKESAATLIKKIKVGDATRYYKPLLTGAVCLKCHGENISPEIQTAIQASYPDDNASNYTLGSFRGVIVSEITKH